MRHEQITQYALLQVITQAIPSWKILSASNEDIALLWNLVRLIHKFTNEAPFNQDRPLFIETVEAWKHILNSPSLRKLFKLEKEKNTGTF
jgi:hypothetical protein